MAEIIQQPWDADGAVESGAFHDWLVGAKDDSMPTDMLAYLRGDQRGVWQTPAGELERRAFVVMRAIDRAFRMVLPETAYQFLGSVVARPGPMLHRMRDRWLTAGCLAHVPAGYVALMGPLSGGSRSEAPEAANGDRFEDQFVNLTVVRPLPAGRKLAFKTLAPSDFMPPKGADHAVGVAPIAQDHADLTFATEVREPRCYLDARPQDPAAIAARVVDVVGAMLASGASLVALPELVLDRSAVGAVRSSIRTGPHPGGKLLVLGTGLSEITSGGTPDLHYNEAVVCDGRGRELFRQRKLNHYSMSPERMRECDITPERDDAHIENCATGDTLTVCDLPGMGRLIVLICEDFAQSTPGRQVAEALSPDWIVTPVLDISLSPGRWPHQKAFSLAGVPKVVVSGSTTLSVRKAGLTSFGELDAAAGVALLYDGGKRGAVRLVTAGQLTGANASAVLAWDSGVWPTTRISTA